MGKRNAALGFIFVTVLIDIIGIGVMVPVLPQLIKDLIHSDLVNASLYAGLLMFSYAFMQFVFSPILGGLSDKYGRRPILLLSLLGLGINYLFHALAPSIGWLFVGRILAGIAGASITTANAYIADISEPEKRAQNFGIVGAAFGLGFFIGPVIGGIAGHHWGVRAPFYLSAGLAFVNLIYGFLVLPESLPVHKRRTFNWKRANPVGSLLHLKNYPIISALIISLFLIHMAGQSTHSVWSFYTMKKFGWSSDQVGYSLGFVGLMVFVVQGGLIRLTIPKLGLKNSIFTGLMLFTIGFLLISFAKNGMVIYLFIIPYCLGGIAAPAIQGVISNQVPDNAQGEIQGAITSLMSLTSILGPIIMTSLFYYFSKPGSLLYYPGAPFALASLFVLVSLFFSIRPLFAFHNMTKK